MIDDRSRPIGHFANFHVHPRPVASSISPQPSSLISFGLEVARDFARIIGLLRSA
jgi:hypothetical protein